MKNKFKIPEGHFLIHKLYNNLEWLQHIIIADLIKQILNIYQIQSNMSPIKILKYSLFKVFSHLGMCTLGGPGFSVCFLLSSQWQKYCLFYNRCLISHCWLKLDQVYTSREEIQSSMRIQRTENALVVVIGKAFMERFYFNWSLKCWYYLTSGVGRKTTQVEVE